MTDKVSKRTAASLAAVAVTAIGWISMPASAQQQAAASDQALIGPGKTAYAQKCSHCHGPNMVTSGTVAPDLRAFPDDNARFSTTVKQGKNNIDRKSTRLNSSHSSISYAVFCLKKKNQKIAQNLRH